MSKQVAQAWKAQVGSQIRVLNTYGPTEATITASVFDLQDDKAEYQDLPIGKPNAIASLYVLDKNRQLVPQNVVGELYIGGQGIAKGYLGNPELTQSRFIQNPFDSATNSKLYRTGDLVRWLPDGRLSFVGRADEQVKIRGYRVELGEIENQLTTEESVANAAVSVCQTESSIQQIVAYLVPASGIQHSALIKQVKSAMESRLPEYMQPSAYIVIDQMPTLENGKIDKSSLPEPNLSALQSTEYVAPTTETEKQICQMWESLLGLDKVGIHDRFFDIGGNSLLVIREIAQLRQTFNLEINISDLFNMQSVRELARYIDAEKELNDGLSIKPAQDVDTPVLETGDVDKWEI